MADATHRRLKRAHTIDDLRTMARRQLPSMIFDYIDGAAGDESTAEANRSGLQALRLVPSAPADVAQRSASTTLFGAHSRLPLIIGPTGYAGSFWPHGDIALARAAERFSIPFVMSSGANVTMETMQREAGGRRWFQLYLPMDRDRWKPMVEEALARDFEVLQVTVDTAIAGKRVRDLRNRFGLPLRWSPALIASIARRPGWILRMAPHSPPRPAVMEHAFAQVAGEKPAALLMSQQVNAGVNWDDLRRLRDLWPRTLVVKGVVDPRQVTPAISAGYNGIVISNHGGRQLDGSVSTIEMLPEFAAEAAGRLTLLIDGGFRSGSDIAKALALGASAVQLGRATLFGLAAGGQHGVERALSILSRELDIAMALCGARGTAELRNVAIRGLKGSVGKS